MIPHLSERAIVLAPQGRDAAVACAMLAEARLRCEIAKTLPEFVALLPREPASAWSLRKR
ncbi:hypothetical protein ACFB49_32810 [Sphingomonas sp. DBB INV C78]